MLRAFVREEDASNAKPLDRTSCDVEREVKSYGNGITFPRDIEDEQTAKAVYLDAVRKRGAAHVGGMSPSTHYCDRCEKC
ncbi:MAG: hypothetical protein RSG23_09450 [Gordonibacter sp.]|uniref:hypothetical protein n=1 Tax=Gordonibacter sp. TaxID=1968902 RepID=UPI002FC8688B